MWKTLRFNMFYNTQTPGGDIAVKKEMLHLRLEELCACALRRHPLLWQTTLETKRLCFTRSHIKTFILICIALFYLEKEKATTEYPFFKTLISLHRLLKRWRQPTTLAIIMVSLGRKRTQFDLDSLTLISNVVWSYGNLWVYCKRSFPTPCGV